MSRERIDRIENRNLWIGRGLAAFSTLSGAGLLIGEATHVLPDWQPAATLFGVGLAGLGILGILATADGTGRGVL